MKKYNHNVEVFTNENDISYYLLGVFMTDGCVITRNGTPVRLTLTSADYEWISRIRDIISPGRDIKHHRSAYVLDIHSKTICKWIISKGCVPCKTLILQYPKVPEKYLPDFIRGCLDGDGSLGAYKRNNINKKSGKIYRNWQLQCYLCSASKDFIDGFVYYLKQNDISYTYFVRKPTNSTINGRTIIPTNPQYRATINANISLIKFLTLIYYDGHKISMKRKNDIALELIKIAKERMNRTISAETIKINRDAHLGSKCIFAKLDEEKVIGIKERLAAGDKVAIIAKDYNISGGTIRNIKRGETWKHVKTKSLKD